MSSHLVSVELDDPRWNELVSASPGALPVHHPGWAQLLADCYGFRAFGLLLENGGGLPMVEVRRRWVSLPFTDSCPPIATDVSRLSVALDGLRRELGLSSIEVRDRLEGPDVHQDPTAVTHTLDLSGGAESVFAGFHKSQVQRSIRKAEKSELELRRAASERELTHDYYGLHLQTRRRQGVPIQPRRFFRLLWQRMIAPGLGYVSLAYLDDVPVGGAVFLSWNGAVIYKYGASDPKFLKLRPNHLIFWDAIRDACENGSHTFDFGRTDLENRGLREFKSGWGATEEPLVYSTISDEAPRPSSRSRLGGVSRGVIRHSPSFVCRGLGELFYKYAA
jgi:GNAT acetyltransferase-like protein